MKITITILLFFISATLIGQTIYSNPMEKNEIGFRDLISIKNALRIGKEKKQRILIYFSGYAVVNARKIENTILTNKQVKSLMVQNFCCFIAYVDDNRKDKSSKTTVGNKYAQIEVKYLKTNLQPYFCILDNNGKILSQIGYVSNPEYFIEFLNTGLK